MLREDAPVTLLFSTMVIAFGPMPQPASTIGPAQKWEAEEESDGEREEESDAIPAGPLGIARARAAPQR